MQLFVTTDGDRLNAELPYRNLTERLAILLPSRHGEVVDFVLLQESVELHPASRNQGAAGAVQM